MRRFLNEELIKILIKQNEEFIENENNKLYKLCAK